MTHHLSDYATRIREQGFRLTPQRQLILDAICEGGQHVTFEEICQRVQAKSSAINQATIYRALEFLSKLHLVTTAEISGDKVYEIATETPHHHLVCRTCGAVESLADSFLSELSARLRQGYHFKTELSHLVITGVCAKCGLYP